MSSAADRVGLAVALLFLAAALHGLGAADIVGDDEAREVGIVQDVAAGHWLLPTFNGGELLPDKPIGFHWLAAIPCALGGFSETAVRLPSALAGAAVVGWTARFGAALFGVPAGLAAATMLATMPAWIGRARVARPDALLVLLVAVALGLAFRWWRDERPRDATLALACVGAATLVKGPVAPVLFGLAFGGFLVWQGELRRGRDFVTVPGLLAFIVLGLGWYVVALAGWGDRFIHEHLLGRYVRNLAGGLAKGGTYSKRPLSYHLAFYVEHLPAIVLPWTPFVALAVWRSWRDDRLGDPRVRFLLAWAAAPVIAFTPAEWKLRYYLLPALPALALLTGPTLVALCRAPMRRARVPVLVGSALAGLVVVGLVAWQGVAAMPALARSDRSTADAVLAAAGGGVGLAALAGIVLGVLLLGVACRAWRAIVGLVVAGGVAWMVAGQPALEQAIARRDTLKPFAAEVATRFPPPAPIVTYAEESIRPLVVYLGRRVPTVHRRDELRPGAVVTTEATWARLAAAGLLGPPVATAEGRIGNVDRTRIVLAETTTGYPRSSSSARR